MQRSNRIINYKSTEAAQYFSSNRVNFHEFYATERQCLDFLITNSSREISILDIGCAAGGLGNALLSEYSLTKIAYVGVDINPHSISAGRVNFPHLNLLCSDFMDQLQDPPCQYSHIISLSCIDWNTSFDDSILAIIRYCKEREVDFCFSFRSSEIGVNSFFQSYQYVNYDGRPHGEIANYVVLGFDELRSIVHDFRPSFVYLCTTVGSPSPTAVTPYSELVFGCILLSYGKAPSLDPSLYIDNIPVYGTTGNIF